MSMTFRSQNVILLAKIESAVGTDAAPVVGSDAMRVEPPAYGFSFDSEETNFARGTISSSAPIINGGMVTLKARTKMMSSASPGVTPPDTSKLFRACAMMQTLLAADLTGTAQAGAAGSITLASSGTSASDNAYRGMVLETTGGTGGTPAQRRVITAYNGTTKVASVYPDFTVTPDNTTGYVVRKCAMLSPITQGQEGVTFYQYLRNSAAAGQALLRKILGSMGGWSMDIAPRKTVSVDFSFQGQLPSLPADVSDPGNATYQSGDPLPYIGAQTFLGGAAIKFNAARLDSGNKPAMFDDPAQTYGYDTSEIVGRSMSGSINPAMGLVATRNAVGDFLNSTSKPLWFCWGSPGKGVSIFLPAIRYTGNEPGNVNGFEVEGLPFRAVGDDGEVLITYF